MTTQLPGIHHVTAFAGDPQQNYDFYTGLLGLRLVKVTINFDDPSLYHLYYADYTGSPGSVLTFFPIPNGMPGRVGSGQATTTQYAAPAGSVDWWFDRLCAEAVEVSEPFQRFGDKVIAFQDPDGLKLEIVEPAGGEARPGWQGSSVPQERVLRGFHAVTLATEGFEATQNLLTQVMGFSRKEEDGVNRTRFQAANGQIADLVDVQCLPSAPAGRMGVGTVHHVAWRTPTLESQQQARQALVEAGMNVTTVRNRDYFQSIYFREPGGVLFEVATDEPGFAVDEPLESLGTALKLPAWLEPRRELVRAKLPAWKTAEGVQFP